jgi:hypothetical protein
VGNVTSFAAGRNQKSWRWIPHQTAKNHTKESKVGRTCAYLEECVGNVTTLLLAYTKRVGDGYLIKTSKNIRRKGKFEKSKKGSIPSECVPASTGAPM